MSNPENLKPWKPGESGNPNGRPKKVITRIAEITQREYGIELTKTDKYDLIEYCLEMTGDELELIIDDSKSPAFLVVIAKAIIKDIKESRITTVEAIFDRVFGRPTQVQAIDPEKNSLNLIEIIKTANES